MQISYDSFFLQKRHKKFMAHKHYLAYICILFQNQFNVVTYSIVGDNEALNLFSIDQNGNIRTTDSLFGRSELSYVVCNKHSTLLIFVYSPARCTRIRNLRFEVVESK